MWSIFRKRQHREADLDREIRAHLELEAEEQRAAGAEAGEARYRARRILGNTTLIKEDTRAAWGWPAVERVLQDFRYALPSMRKTPAFTAVAVLSLALGIGANVAIFTFVNAALLKQLPYPDSDRIVVVLQRPPKGDQPLAVHPRSFIPWHDRARSFEAMAIAQSIPVNTQGVDGAEQISGLWATAELFRVFGVRPLMGRLFEEGEGLNRAAIRGGLAGVNSVAILSHGYWQRRFGADPAIVGRTMPVERGSVQIVGVLPADFRLHGPSIDVYLPLPLDRTNPAGVGSRAFHCFGLLRPGVTLDAARAEMAVLAAGVGREDESEKDWTAVVMPLRDYLVRDNRRVLLVLLGVVLFVLLIACANLAGLLLTRGVGRRGEFALRASLGAARGRLVQQLLIESLTLSAGGGVLGLLAGWLGSRTLAVLAKDAVTFGQLSAVTLDLRVFAFAAALALLTALIVGLAPALEASRFDVQGALREHGRGGAGRGQQRLRALLVVGEVALAVVLLVGAGLLLRTLNHLLHVPLGFEPRNVLTMRTLVMGDAARRAGLVEAILGRVQALPGVRAAGTVQFLPMTGFANNWVFQVIGRPPARGERMESDGATVSHGYLKAMGIPVLRGRDFSPHDSLNSARVALVTESFVRKYFAREDPIGRLIIGDWSDPKQTQIVGVVADFRQTALTSEPRPTILLAQSQSPGYITYLAVQTEGRLAEMAAAVRAEVRKVDPNQPVTTVQPMSQYLSAELARPKLYGSLLTTFAGLALLLAGIGLYGLMAYSVSQRTHEIGVRLALGARPRDVLTATLAEGTRLMLAGVGLGAGAALMMSSVVGKLLYGVRSGDPVSFAAAVLVLCAAGALAAYLPGRRAARVDPMVALRYE